MGTKTNVRGHIEPWTLKGVLGTAAMALIRVAIALERIATVLEHPAPVHREDGKANG